MMKIPSPWDRGASLAALLLLLWIAGCDATPSAPDRAAVNDDPPLFGDLTLSTETPTILPGLGEVPVPEGVSELPRIESDAWFLSPPGLEQLGWDAIAAVDRPHGPGPGEEAIARGLDRNEFVRTALIFQNASTGAGSMWILEGGTWRGRFAPIPRVLPPWRIVGAGDITGDGRDEIVWRNSVTGGGSIWVMDELSYSGTFLPLPRLSAPWEIQAISDLNGDGRANILWRNLETGTMSIWVGEEGGESGTFESFPILPGFPGLIPEAEIEIRVDPEWVVVGAGDFSGDGSQDLLWRNPGSGNNSIWILEAGTFSGEFSQLPVVPPSWSVGAVADYARDSTSEIVWREDDSGRQVVWRLAGATFDGDFHVLPTVPSPWRIRGGLRAPTEVEGPVMVSFSGASTRACALSETGRLYCWGNAFTGHEAFGRQRVPVEVAPGTAFQSVEVGSTETSCALTVDGTAYCWGANNFGAVGDGTTESRNEPVPVAGDFTFEKITSGSQICGLTGTGEIYCWGRWDGLDEDSSPDTCTERSIPCATTPTQVPGVWSDVSSSLFVTCALDVEGSAYCWGQNDFTQIPGAGSAPSGPYRIPGDLTFASIHTGAVYTCGITAGGEVYCWGSRFSRGIFGDGVLVGQAPSEPVRAAGGLLFSDLWVSNANNIQITTCGRTPAGDFYCWGSDERLQIGAEGAAEECGPFGGLCTSTPLLVELEQDFVTMQTGSSRTCGLTESGEIWCWGTNEQGQYGRGVTSDGGRTPVRVLFPPDL